jgi:hypothetical protein
MNNTRKDYYQRQREAKEQLLHAAEYDLGQAIGNVAKKPFESQIEQLLQDIENLDRNIEKLDRSNIILKFPEVSHFDLRDIINTCLDKALDKKELVGFSVSYNETLFLTNFKERLKHLRGRDKADVRFWALSALFNESNKTDQEIEIIKTKLKIKDVVCLIRIDIKDPDSNMVRDFWRKMQNAFLGELENCLIVVMAADQDCLLPIDTTIQLPEPKFARNDLHKWFLPVADSGLDDARLPWINKMMERCAIECSGYLETSSTYVNLESTLNQLKKTSSSQDFLEFINESL